MLGVQISEVSNSESRLELEFQDLAAGHHVKVVMYQGGRPHVVLLEESEKCVLPGAAVAILQRGAQYIVHERNAHGIGTPDTRYPHEFLTQGKRDHFICVQYKDPVPGCLLESESPGGVGETHALVRKNPCPKLAGNINRPVIAEHIDDDDFVDPRLNRPQCKG
jgi:hypothetical protein